VPRISREAVLDVARDLPIEQMTLTAISDRLGVTVPALYRYFADRTAILDALAHEAREKLVPPDAALPWDEWLVEAANRERALWQRHANLYDAANYRAISHPSLEMARVGLHVLRTAGFTTVDALCALTTIIELAHVMGHAEAREENLLDPSDADELAGWAAEAEEPITPDLVLERSIAIVIDGLRTRL
jgi:AcrR family transcriptional regulator